MELKDLKKEYAKFEKKYRLPSFRELDENFEIEKIDRESDCLLKMIRKAMMDKVVNSLNFLEMLLNPLNCPRLYMGFVRAMDSEDKKNIEDIYSILGELSVNAMYLEIEYSEKGEAEMIKKIFGGWNKSKPGFKKIIDGIKAPKSLESKREKSYFG